MARAGFLVVACVLSMAGQAQERVRDLDHAVSEIIGTLVNGGRLTGQKVYVGADDFFEEESELRPPLSKILRTMCLRALTDRQVEVALVPSEAVQVLHGRWRRESESHLHLTLFIADPPRGREEPVATRSDDALVPVEGLRPRDIEPTLRHWGDRVVRRLERDVPGSGRFRLHLAPLSIQDSALSERFGPYLVTHWRPAFTGSDRFTLVGSAQAAEGVVHGDVFVVGGRVEVGLSILDKQGSPVASDHVALERSLFPSDIVIGGGPDDPPVTGSLTVRTEPANARVRVITSPDSEYQDRMPLAPGQYEVQVEAEGHEPFRKSLKIDGSTTYRISLCRLKARTTRVCHDRPVTRHRTESQEITGSIDVVESIDLQGYLENRGVARSDIDDAVGSLMGTIADNRRKHERVRDIMCGIAKKRLMNRMHEHAESHRAAKCRADGGTYVQGSYREPACSPCDDILTQQECMARVSWSCSYTKSVQVPYSTTESECSDETRTERVCPRGGAEAVVTLLQ